MLSISIEELQKAEERIYKNLENLKRVRTRDTRGLTSLVCAEVEALSRAIAGDRFKGIVNAYNYGFIRGVNYQKSQQRKRAQGGK